jgi:hypothetical protein
MADSIRRGQVEDRARRRLGLEPLDPRAAHTHPAPLPRRIAELQRRSDPTRSLHAPIHFTLLPQPRAACKAAFLLYPCYKGNVAFGAPYAVTSAAAGYSIDGFARCRVGGRPEMSWSSSAP